MPYFASETLLANIEALTDSPENSNPNERPRYINKTKIYHNVETKKIEVGECGVKMNTKEIVLKS